MILSKKVGTVTNYVEELWYNKRMNYPKIDLKTIRQESKHFQADTPVSFSSISFPVCWSSYLVFLIPYLGSTGLF